MGLGIQIVEAVAVVLWASRISFCFLFGEDANRRLRHVGWDGGRTFFVPKTVTFMTDAGYESCECVCS